MEEIYSKISKNNYNTIFPFHFIIDKNLKIIQAGNGLLKVLPNVIDNFLNDIFIVKRPFSITYEFDKIIQFSNQVFILESKNTNLLFRGQVIHIEDNDLIIFIGSPWILNVDELKKYGLLITDFAMHDTIPDMLQVMKSQEMDMKDMKLLVLTLNEQKRNLKESYNHHLLQYSISQILLSTLSIEHTIENVIKLMCECLSFKCGSFWMISEENISQGEQIIYSTTSECTPNLRCVSYWQNETIKSREFKNKTETAVCKIGNGLPGKIWETNQINYDFDLSNDDNLERSSSLKSLNLDYSLGLPIFDEKSVLGVFEFYFDQIIDKDHNLLQLLKIIGNQICHYILKIKSDDYIKESEKRYKQIVEEASDVIYRVDLRGYFEYINPVVKTILNLSDFEIIGTHFLNLVHKSHRRKVRRFYDEQLKNEIPLTYLEFITVNNKNIEKWIGQKTSIIYENGIITGFQAVGRDITERKQNENQLILAKENAEKSKLIKDQFLANMSHEIRTPMNAIIGMSEIMEESNLNNQQKECIDAIKSSGENLLLIINDILDFSKIESGKIIFEKTPFNIMDVVKSVLNTLHFSAEKKGLNLISKFSKEIPTILIGDSVRLRQILINLISNAIKFTEIGEISIELKLIEHDAENYKINFQINDTGIGIPNDKISSIFDSFTQASSDTTRKYGGTGLGLTIVKQLIELQDGDISVSSEINCGSTFSFILTFIKGEQPVYGSVNHVEKYSYTELHNLRILLAEDNSMNQKVAKMVFNKWGCILDIADNGKIAIEKLAANNYDIVLMDMQMPIMDGYEATLFIRKSMTGQKSTIPIMAMTAHAMEGEKEKCLSFGMDDYISKPFNQKILFEKIVNLTAKST